jgi:subtilisin family serine protease
VLALALLASATAGASGGDQPATPDNLSDQQWPLEQIGVFAAHNTTGGSPFVRVALLDSGIDPNHPEFAGRIDRAASVNCTTGTPQVDPTGALWTDDVGHGTQVAGVVAAGDNDFGIVGVAPNVQLVIVKIVGRGQPITPAAAACGFDWVATHDIDVVNASFAIDKGATGGADALDFFCRTNPDDDAAIRSVGRAVRNAQRAGAIIVASAGNNGIDMAHPAAGEDCLRMPVQLPGVIGVSSEGRQGTLATSNPPGASNYGFGAIDLVAPGGDPAQGGVPGGLILSTFPSYIPVPPTAMPNIVDGPAGSTFRYTAGSSFAAAHVTGVTALVASRWAQFRFPRIPLLRSALVAARLLATGDERACPADPNCEGSRRYNGFYGFGQVDALAAVSR